MIPSVPTIKKTSQIAYIDKSNFINSGELEDDQKVCDDEAPLIAWLTAVQSNLAIVRSKMR